MRLASDIPESRVYRAVHRRDASEGVGPVDGSWKEKENWGTPEQLSDPHKLKKDLLDTHAALIQKLESFDDSLLSRNVPGEYYDFYKLLNGLIQHDTYHLGMIWVLWQ